ncbi:MAG: GNAT family N-acetyltransferase [Treponema sp.]|jgi:[citrate (pro-3S)-lyase] ligase|nr:GNAT family N-acetyltransferase [Treponema sp.]
MDIRTGSPFQGRYREELRCFLARNGLKYDERIGYSLCLIEDEEIAATGSLDGNILKCIAVSPDFQEGGLAARIVSGLIDEAARNGVFHLFLFTKPENEALFRSLGFFTITKTGNALLMENKKNGVAGFVAALGACGTLRNSYEETPDFTHFEAPLGVCKEDFCDKSQKSLILGAKPHKLLEKPETVNGGAAGRSGAIVMNCNPFTLGHRYLAERAAAECDVLHIFVVSEEKSAFPAEVRLRLAGTGTAHLKNALVHPSGPYLISAATFPDYFIKDTVCPETVNALLDLKIFAERFARPLGITRRFVGEEPLDPVTGAYNRQMKEALPSWGIAVREIPRLEKGGGPVSAGRVRNLLSQGRLEEALELVPPATADYLRKWKGGGI